MALAEKWVHSTSGAVTPEVGVIFDRIQVVETAKFHTLEVANGHTDNGYAVANATVGSAVAISPGLYEGKWTEVRIHSGLLRVYEAF